MALPILTIATIVGSILPDAIRLLGELKNWKKNESVSNHPELSPFMLEETLTKQTETIITLTQTIQKLSEELEAQSKRTERIEKVFNIILILVFVSLSTSIGTLMFAIFLK